MLNKSTFVKAALTAVGMVAFCGTASAEPTCTVNNNYCHVIFTMNNFTSSTFTQFNTPGYGFSGTGANISAPQSAGTYTSVANNGTTNTTLGNTYQLDSSGNGSLALSAQIKGLAAITWTLTQGGELSFNWKMSGQSSIGSISYLFINGKRVATMVGPTDTSLIGGVSTPTPTAGQLAFYGLNGGDTISFRLSGGTTSASNTTKLEIFSFKGVPEIDGAVLPAGLLLMGIGCVSYRRRFHANGEMANTLAI